MSISPSDKIKVAIDGNIATVTIDNPAANTWDRESLPALKAVIEALNADLPYGDFVRMQLAGDVLEPGPGVVATGMLVAGPWDFVGQVEVADGTSEKRRVRSLDRDDMVATVATALLSTTAQCARCHDHKFDPISQEESFTLQAVFAGVDRAEVAFDADPATAARRRELQRAVQGLEQRRAEREAELTRLLLKAPGARDLEVERDRRYPTAAAIADDVRRQLDGKPVHARPPSQAYRIRRFVRRHRTAALGAAATFIALVLGAFIASKEYRRAQDEARIATARSAFVQDLLAGSIPGAELATRARLAFGADHAAVAEALGVAAARAREEGELSSAIQLLEESVRAWQALYPGGHIRVARAHGRLADALHVQGDLQSAEAQYRLAMAAAGVDSPLVLEREGLARILRNRGEAEEAGSLLAEAVEMRRLHYPEQRESLAATLNSLSEVLRRLGLNERSAQVYREMITESRGAFPAESLVHAEQQLAFGVTLRSLGQRVEAEGHLRSGLAQFEDSGFPRGASYLAGLLALAGVLEDEADPGTQREIDMLLLNAEQITRRLHGPDSLQLANLLERSSQRSSQRGELLEATRRQQEALEIRSRALGDSFQPTEEVGVLSRLASRIAGSAGITREAYATALEAVEFLTAQVTDPESLRVLRTRLALRLEPEVEQLRELERELNPDREKLDPERLALLALVHSQLGQPTLARNYLSHAESLTIETGRDSDRDLTQLLDEVRQAIGEF